MQPFRSASTVRSAPAIFPVAIAALCLLIALTLAACGGASSGKTLAKRDAKYALEVLDRAPEHGFPQGAFNVRAIHAAMDRKDKHASALLRAAVLDYARAQHGHLIPKGSRPAAWGSAAPAYDAEADLNAALQRRDFHKWIDGLPPTDPTYRVLQAAYAQGLASPTPEFQARSATLRANLERLRWLPRDVPPTRIDVNIASANLVYVVDGAPRMTMKTASGKPGDETPMLASKIDHIVLNPPWNVPDGIAADELFPKGEAYLAENGYVTKDDGRLMQQPGPDSALGLVKFDFDNPYAVYLHDTPAKAAFNRSTRAVSHGCVRLERAVDLANVVLGGQPGWSPQRIQDTIAAGETKTVKLQNPVTVRLMYVTAGPQDGRIVYLPDVYGWDTQTVQLMDRFALRAGQRA